MKTIKIQLQYLIKALIKLKEALTLGDEEIVRDGTIQRFEFTFELAWKLMKKINAFYGIETNSPRQAIKQAFREKIISNNPLWLEILECRNIISHTYSEESSLNIYNNIKKFIPLFDELITNIQKIIDNKED